MKAAYICQTGSPDVIQVGELPAPQPQAGQILVQVDHVAVNPIDTYIRSGAVAMPLPNPFIIGCDFAGVVTGLGEGVSRFRIGDRVWGSNQGLLGRQGTFAQQIAVDQAWAHPLPDGVASEDVAAVALVAITAHLGLFRDAKLAAGESILVIGGTGGVGSMVVQMAKLAGAHVITTAGSDAKAAAALALGADQVIAYHREPIGEAITRLATDGVNVFWETRREPDFDLAVAAMAPRGRMVLMAGRDARPAFPVGPFYVKECSLHGMVMFKASVEEIAKAAADINSWLSSQQLKANISARLTLDQAVQSHQLQEAATLHGHSELAGKIVLSLAEPGPG